LAVEGAPLGGSDSVMVGSVGSLYLVQLWVERGLIAAGGSLRLKRMEDDGSSDLLVCGSMLKPASDWPNTVALSSCVLDEQGGDGGKTWLGSIPGLRSGVSGMTSGLSGSSTMVSALPQDSGESGTRQVGSSVLAAGSS